MTHLPLFVPALPWAVALSLVWRATGHGDGPARLLRLVTAALPDERREWGRALAAELEHVKGRVARRRFALGGLRVAAQPHPSPRRPALVGRVYHAVGGCYGLTVTMVIFHPGVVGEVDVVALLLSVLLLWACVRAAKALPAAPVAGRAGTGAAVTLGLVLLLSPHLGDPAAPEGAFFFLVLGPVVVFALWSAAAAAVGRSFRAGVRAALRGTALGTPLMFLGGILATVTWVETGSRAFFDGEPGLTVEASLAEFLWLLPVVPLLGLPFGVIGARLALIGRMRPRILA